MINISVKPGWAGGSWHTAQFRDELVKHGYTLTKDVDADVVVAHSVACLDLTLKSPAKYFILIDPPYWPGKPMTTRFFSKQLADNKAAAHRFGKKYIVKKLAWGLWYAVTKPAYLGLALRAPRVGLSFLNDLKGKNVLVVRNHDDLMCSPEIKIALTAYPHVYYMELPGQHDDYYTNPSAYIALLPKHL